MTMKLFSKHIGTGDRNLIVIHGLYGSSDNWLTIARNLEDICNIYLIDQRNHGLSPHSSEMNYEVMADDLNEFMIQESLESAIIMGHSMGGKTAMRFALKYPQKVEKLLILDIAPKSYDGFSNYAQITNDHRSIVDALLSVNPKEFSSRSGIDKFLKDKIPNNMVRSFLLKNVGRAEDKTLFWKLNIQAISDNLHNIMSGFNDLEDNGGFPEKKEVYLIRGANSPYVQEEDIQSVRKLFPSAQLTTIPDAGHWLHAEQPEIFVKTTRYFLES